jgi:hypothetical protein
VQSNWVTVLANTPSVGVPRLPSRWRRRSRARRRLSRTRCPAATDRPTREPAWAWRTNISLCCIARAED